MYSNRAVITDCRYTSLKNYVNTKLLNFEFLTAELRIAITMWITTIHLTSHIITMIKGISYKQLLKIAY